jgi:5'-3' exonuclease
MNIILIDASYTSFHRFYATLRWYSFAHKDEYKEYKGNKEYDWTTNKIFINKYKKMYLESIIKLIKKKIYKNSILIFCQDSPHETIWRHEFVKCYKGKRVNHNDKINISSVFRYTYNIIIPELVKEKHIFKLMIDKIEGDDIIAIISKYIRRKLPDKKTYIISGDKDFYQLGHKNLYFADYKKKEILIFTRKEAKQKLLEKILDGDCSDNIPSIFKNIKINKSEKDKMKNDKKYLISFLKKPENKKIKKQFKLNCKAINFKYIPKKYQKQVLQKIQLFNLF